MTVRVATLSDVDRLLELARQEHAASRFAHQKFDPLAARTNLEAAVAGMLTRVFISEGGFIAGMVQPCLFNRYFTGYELCWFARDGSGLKLLDALRGWCKQMRATDLVVHNYAGIAEPGRFERVMQRAGFAVLGTSFIQSLA
jgi:hypothetical protein